MYRIGTGQSVVGLAVGHVVQMVQTIQETPAIFVYFIHSIARLSEDRIGDSARFCVIFH
jgi:hypothetical protein